MPHQRQPLMPRQRSLSPRTSNAFHEHLIHLSRVDAQTDEMHFMSISCVRWNAFHEHFMCPMKCISWASHLSHPCDVIGRHLVRRRINSNLLRSSSRIHPSLSAHASLFGNYDSNRTPIAPPGTKVVASTSAGTRTTFGEHGQTGWYIGLSGEHYRCYRCYFPSTTMAERDVLTVDPFPEKIRFQSTRPKIISSKPPKICSILLQTPVPSSQLAPALAIGPPILNEYATIAEILRCATPPAPTPAPSQRALAVPPPVPPQRMPVVPPSPAPPLLPKKLPPPQRPRSLPNTYHDINLRFRTRPSPRLQFAQSIQHRQTLPSRHMPSLLIRSFKVLTAPFGPPLSPTNAWLGALKVSQQIVHLSVT